MSLFTYLLRIFFFFFEREDVFLKMCYSFQENKTSPAQSPSPVSWKPRPVAGEGWLRGRQRHLCAACGRSQLQTLPASALSRLLVTENWEVSRAPVGGSEVTEPPVL